MKTTTVKLNEIKLISEYLRLETDVETLKTSISKIGLINPITINLNNELLAGARRFQAVKELGWDEVPVHVVDRGALEQELISIDENLVRKPLSKMEFEKCLNRGREIYESINPTANKVELEFKELSNDEKKKQKELEEQDEDSFAAITAEKTGLSKSIIKGAIKRDALASESVKKARSLGTINASQTNEIIKLDKEVQDKILPIIADKTVKEAKKIIETARKEGHSKAAQVAKELIPLPKEYANLRNLAKRVNKNFSRILLEELEYTGPEQKLINKELFRLKENVDNYFRIFSNTDEQEKFKSEIHLSSHGDDEETMDSDFQNFTPEYLDENNFDSTSY